MWNLRNLTPPPNFTYKCTTVDVATLKKACLKAVAILQDQKQLHSEAALLSRFLYSMKTKFRSDKGFDILGKVNRSLLQYLSLNLHTAYVNFCECVPNPSDADQYVPSRQMLQYLLVRTQSFAQLWCYIISHCQEAAQYLRARMGLGHNWWAAVVALAITSRIWAFGKYLIICACEWFSQLKPFLEVLKVNGPPWLPDNYRFPDDLHQWLDANLQEESSSKKFGTKVRGAGFSIDKLFAMSDDNDIEDGGDDDVQIIDDCFPSENVEECSQQYIKTDIVAKSMGHVSQDKSVRSLKEDIGELVTRESVGVINGKNNYQNAAADIDMLKLSSSNKQPNNEYTSDNYPNIEQSNSIAKRLNKIQQVNPEIFHKASSMAVAEKSKKVEHTSDNSSQSFTSRSSMPKRIKKQIIQLKTHFDLISFLQMEETLRNQCKTSCVTHNLDKLQWNMLKNLISSYVPKLKKRYAAKNEEKYEILMKKVRKAIAVTLK